MARETYHSAMLTNKESAIGDAIYIVAADNDNLPKSTPTSSAAREVDDEIIASSNTNSLKKHWSSSASVLKGASSSAKKVKA
jgi:hypothetical protein